MRRRAEYLVEKRCGRREWLRATKLARSILLALSGAGRCAPERAALALRLASAVLAHVRGQATAPSPVVEPRSELTARLVPVGVITTPAIAAAAVHELLAAGEPLAARRYVEVGLERRRRAAVLHDLHDGLEPRVVPASPVTVRAPGRAGDSDTGLRW